VHLRGQMRCHHCHHLQPACSNIPCSMSYVTKRCMYVVGKHCLTTPRAPEQQQLWPSLCGSRMTAVAASLHRKACMASDAGSDACLIPCCWRLAAAHQGKQSTPGDQSSITRVQSLITPSVAPQTAGRAAGIAVALFFAGSLFGGLLENWVRVDIVPIGVSALHGAAALGAGCWWHAALVHLLIRLDDGDGDVVRRPLQ
jgi:hypothetical protein